MVCPLNFRSRRMKPIIVDPGLYLAEKTAMFYATQKRDFPNAYQLFSGEHIILIFQLLKLSNRYVLFKLQILVYRSPLLLIFLFTFVRVTKLCLLQTHFLGSYLVCTCSPFQIAESFRSHYICDNSLM